ncbi:MAG TPA: hypothetical protein VER33_16135 [Polyangiaceae bacterium]|nr:hypothetical protein [Polyangiaceae bacterium]
MRELSALPRSSTRLGRLVAQCHNTLSWSPFKARSLLELDCNTARLRRLLREVASEQGGDVLAAIRCSGGNRPHCSAVLGLTSRPSGPAQAEAPRVAQDIRGGLGSEVYVSFAPNRVNPARARRAPESVREVPFLPPSHVAAGSVSAYCTTCEALPLRDALRIVGGQLGVSDLVGLSCVPWQKGHRCTALAALPEVEPDPSAGHSLSSR